MGGMLFVYQWGATVSRGNDIVLVLCNYLIWRFLLITA